MTEHSIRITAALLDYLGYTTQEYVFSDVSEKSIDLIVERIEKNWSIVFASNLSQNLPKYLALRTEGVYLESLSQGKVVKFGDDCQYTPYDTNVIQLFSRILYLTQSIGRIVEYRHISAANSSVSESTRDEDTSKVRNGEEVVTGYAGIVAGSKHWEV